MTTERARRRGSKPALKLLARERKRLRIGQVYLVHVAVARGVVNAFNWSGLRRLRGDQVVSARSLAVYRAAAKQLER